MKAEFILVKPLEVLEKEPLMFLWDTEICDVAMQHRDKRFLDRTLVLKRQVIRVVLLGPEVEI
jgi:hypothetical protein